MIGENGPGYYKGTEPSPKGFGVLARHEVVGVGQKGRDGRYWTVKADKNGRKYWSPTGKKKKTGKKSTRKKKPAKKKTSTKKKKRCPANKIRNPKSKRCVLRTGKIGRSIIAGEKSKRTPPKALSEKARNRAIANSAVHWPDDLVERIPKKFFLKPADVKKVQSRGHLYVINVHQTSGRIDELSLANNDDFQIIGGDDGIGFFYPFVPFGHSKPLAVTGSGGDYYAKLTPALYKWLQRQGQV